MKKTLLTLVYFLLFYFSSLAQTISVTYEIENKLPAEVLKILPADKIGMIASRPLRKSFLYHKDGKSSFREQSDTLFAVGYEDKTGEIPLYEKAIFKDLFEETLIYIDMLNDSTAAAIAQIDLRKEWNKTGETKEILGYICQHVQNENRYGVMENIWYTNDISIFDGPGDICGFPGLVLEYERAGKHLKAIEIKQDQQGKYPLLPPTIKDTISYTEFENRLASRLRF